MSRKAEFYRVLSSACRQPWGLAWLERVHAMTCFVHGCLLRDDKETADEYLRLLVSSPEQAEELRVDETARHLLDGVDLGG